MNTSKQISLFTKLSKYDAEKQLICFPYLGGYVNSYLDLANSFDSGIEVWAANPPGHGSCTEEPLQDISSLLTLYYKELQAIVKPGYMLLGHSMGGILAYFLARKIICSESDFVSPAAVVVSASNPPSEFLNKRYSMLSDEEIIARMRSYGGIPDVLVKEEKLLSFFAPVFRADFAVLESAATQPVEPLDIDGYLLWGDKDKIVAFESTLEWKQYFAKPVNFLAINDGSHMFIHDKTRVVAEALENIFRSDSC